MPRLPYINEDSFLNNECLWLILRAHGVALTPSKAVHQQTNLEREQGHGDED